MVESSEDSSYSEHNEDSEYTGDSEEALSDDERVTTIAQSYCPSNQTRRDLRESLDFQQALGVVANAPTNDVLADAAGEFFAFLCTEEFVDSQSSSALLVFFCGTLGFSADGLRFDRPRDYTPKLSAMIYCVRLCLLEVTLPRFAHLSATWGARPRSGHLKRFNPIRERFLCNGCQAAMGELLSLRYCGRAFSRADGPSFRVSWSDDSKAVSWDDGQINMDQFRRLGQVVLQSVKLSMARLMYGLTPSIRLEDIRDHWSDQTPGYSFVYDAANNLSSAYLALSARACLDPVGGLVTGDRWDLDAVRRYLKEEQHLLLQFLLLIYLRSGQAARIPDLARLEVVNGPSTSRGIYVQGASMICVTRTGKARQSTNQEFNIARYLSRADSAFLARYLAYVRPFADMLARQCYGQEKERRLLFATVENPDQPWKVTVVSQALKMLSQQVCGTAIGVQIYRQLSIAITERHVTQISRPFNRYDDKSTQADIEVAFAWQSGHRPIQRGTNYGIDSAYPDSLQPALLRIYRWASMEWQKFLQVDQASPSEQLPSPIASQSSSQAIKRRLPAGGEAQCVSKYRRLYGGTSRVSSKMSENNDESPNGAGRSRTRTGASPLDSNISPILSKILREEQCVRYSPRTTASPAVPSSPPIHPGRVPRLKSTPSMRREETSTNDDAQLSAPTASRYPSSRVASNEYINRLLSSTRQLCRPDHYRHHIRSTPTRPIQGSCICYCPSLEVLLCLGCSRCLSPDTYLQHLKRRHSTAYRHLDPRALARLQQEISGLSLTSVDELVAISHNTHYFPDLPITFNNFKCQECWFVDVNKKVVRTHFHAQHQPLTKSINRKVIYVLEHVPLQTLEGFLHNRKIHFIPKLPEVSHITLPGYYDLTEM